MILVSRIPITYYITYNIYFLYEFCTSDFLISNLFNEDIFTSKFEIRSGGTINRVVWPPWHFVSIYGGRNASWFEFVFFLQSKISLFECAYVRHWSFITSYAPQRATCTATKCFYFFTLTTRNWKWCTQKNLNDLMSWYLNFLPSFHKFL